MIKLNWKTSAIAMLVGLGIFLIGLEIKDQWLVILGLIGLVSGGASAILFLLNPH